MSILIIIIVLVYYIFMIIWYCTSYIPGTVPLWYRVAGKYNSPWYGTGYATVSYTAIRTQPLYLAMQNKARTQQGAHALIPPQQNSIPPSPWGVSEKSGFALRYSLTARTSWALAKQSQNMWRQHSLRQQSGGNGFFGCACVRICVWGDEGR